MIGERMKEARMALGYSAEHVAAFLKVSPATIYRYENGDISKFPSNNIKPLAEFLCVSPAYLMGWSDDGPSSQGSESKPQTKEARIISGGIDKMSKERREQALRVLQAAFEEFSDLIKEEPDDDT